MKKYIVFALVLGLLVFGVSQASALVSSTSVVTKGTTGAEVTTIQSALNNQGYSLVADGNFGAKTETAVMAFQASKGLPVTGIVDSATKSSILSATTASPVSASATSVTAVNPNLPCALTAPVSIKVISPNGGQTYTAGQQVTVKWSSCNIPTTANLQFSLFMYYPANNPTATGFPLTLSTLNDGQETFNLPLAGNVVYGWSTMQYGNFFKIYVGYPTAGVGDVSDNMFTIITPPPPTSATTSTTIAKGATGSAVTAIQSALNSQGYALTVDSSYGTKTETAVKTYQAIKGLPVTGIVDSATKASILA
ncbi:MAG: peptidoglycan-binding domain-containing protein, partial [Phenylobacterium sp.]|uniref:peptidoglycan-binding domain-containing protein n=1 Tax=Phenylobacterium sp. TaxID=1871053 RepID=UPI002732FA07